MVATRRPVDAVALTAAARYASLNDGAHDISNIIGITYQGFYQYFVVDLRAQFEVADQMHFGVDVGNNAKCLVCYPSPQRTFAADVKSTL